MPSPHHSPVTTFDGGAQRVLLLVENARDRELLADQLGTHEVVVPDSLADLPQFDVCLVDTRTFPRVEDQLTGRKADADPVFVPVLLVIGADAPASAVQMPPTVVDEVLAVPTSKAVFKRRLESLLEPSVSPSDWRCFTERWTTRSLASRSRRPTTISRCSTSTTPSSR